MLLLLPLHALLTDQAAASTENVAEVTSDETALAGAGGEVLGDVIALLQQMLQDFEAQSEEDKAAWQRYQEWSNKAEASRRGIAQALASSAVQSQAVLASDSNEVQDLGMQLTMLNTAAGNAKASIKEVQEWRKDARNEYTQSTADLIKTIGAVRKAIDVVSAEKASGVKAAIPAESLLLVRNAAAMYSSKPALQASKVAAFLQGDTRSVTFRGHSAMKVNKNSKADAQAILDTLVDLRVNLERKRNDQLFEEGQAVGRLQNALSVKATELSRARQEMVEKGRRKSDAEAGEKLSRLEVERSRAGIHQMADDLKVIIAEQTRLYDAFTRRLGDRLEDAQTTRKALQSLMKITPGLDQSMMSFVQVQKHRRLKRSHHAPSQSPGHANRIQNLISLEGEVAKLALSLKSPQLAQAASLLEAQRGTGPNGEVEFDVEGVKAVGKMLRGVLEGLEAKERHETSQRQWCALEVKNGKTNQEDNDKHLKELRLQVQLLSSEAEQLQSTVEFLENESKQADLEAKVALEIRSQQHESFQRAIGDYDDAIATIKVGMQTMSSQQSLLQTEKEDQVADQKAAGRGMMLQTGSMSSLATLGQSEEYAQEVLRTLSQLIQRYSSTRARLVADEDLAAKHHKDLSARSKRLKRRTARASVSRAAERRRRLRELARNKAEIEQILARKTKLHDYMKVLDPSCLEILTAADSQRSRRATEIAALRELHHALDDPTDVNREFNALPPKPSNVDPELQGKPYAKSPER